MVGQEAGLIRREKEPRTLIALSTESYYVDRCWPQAPLCEPIDSSENPGSKIIEWLVGVCWRRLNRKLVNRWALTNL